MSNVYAVNKINSSIEVNSWNLYFIDSVNNTGVELITVYDHKIKDSIFRI